MLLKTLIDRLFKRILEKTDFFLLLSRKLPLFDLPSICRKQP